MRYVTRGIAAVAAVAAVSLLAVSTAAAQHPQTRKGFWIGFGFGYGSYGCTGCSSTGSVSGYLKLGGTLNKHWLLGGETDGWTKSESGVTFTAGNVSATAYYYPQPASGFFARAGVGFSEARASSGGVSASNSGPGATAGVGYDMRIAANTSITPVANFIWGHIASGESQHILQLAVGITFH
jgi:hypothetical protein